MNPYGCEIGIDPHMLDANGLVDVVADNLRKAGSLLTNARLTHVETTPEGVFISRIEGDGYTEKGAKMARRES